MQHAAAMGAAQRGHLPHLLRQCQSRAQAHAHHVAPVGALLVDAHGHAVRLERGRGAFAAQVRGKLLAKGEHVIADRRVNRKNGRYSVAHMT